MKINFLLPQFPPEPIGGFKVVYEYANALCGRGHEVRVVHSAWGNVSRPVSLSNAPRHYFKRAAGLWAARRLAGARVGWFDLDPGVEQIIVPELGERCIPDGDAVIATAWTTAEWTAALSARKGRKFYLIQHYEIGAACKSGWMRPGSCRCTRS